MAEVKSEGTEGFLTRRGFIRVVAASACRCRSTVATALFRCTYFLASVEFVPWRKNLPSAALHISSQIYVTNTSTMPSTPL